MRSRKNTNLEKERETKFIRKKSVEIVSQDELPQEYI